MNEKDHTCCKEVKLHTHAADEYAHIIPGYCTSYLPWLEAPYF